MVVGPGEKILEVNTAHNQRNGAHGHGEELTFRIGPVVISAGRRTPVQEEVFRNAPSADNTYRVGRMIELRPGFEQRNRSPADFLMNLLRAHFGIDGYQPSGPLLCVEIERVVDDKRISPVSGGVFLGKNIFIEEGDFVTRRVVQAREELG